MQSACWPSWGGDGCLGSGYFMRSGGGRHAGSVGATVGGLLGLRQGPACGSACRRQGQKGCHNAVALRRVCFFKKND
jgi:hypothetical protein